MMIVEMVNIVEIFWWIGCGIYLFVRSRATEEPLRTQGRRAAMALAAFGVSDAVELWSGAWWKPWWLLVWKGICIVVLANCAISYLKNSRRS